MQAIRLAAVYATVFGMEMSWLYAALLLANRSVNDQLSSFGLLSILPISFAVFKALRRFIKFSKLADLIGWLVIWPLATLSAIKTQLFAQTSFKDTAWLSSIPQALSHIFTNLEPALLLIICSALLWWLGRHLAVIKLDFSATISQFQFGLIMLILIYLIAYGLKAETQTALPVTLIFFTCGLTGISISHDQASKGWFSSLKQWHWSAMLLASVGVILLGGLLVSIIFSPDLIQLIIKGIKWLWDVADHIMRWLASLIPPSNDTMPPLPGTPEVESNPDAEMFHFPPALRISITVIWTVIVGGLILLAIWRVTSQLFDWMRRKGGSGGGESEKLRVNFWQDWLNWLKHLFSSIFRIKLGGTKMRKTENHSEATAVRQIYRQWLLRMASAGYPRRKEQTPLEYQSVVEAIVGLPKEAVNEITNIYIQSRYGAAIPSVQELENVKEQWSLLKKADLKRGKKDKNTRE